MTGSKDFHVEVIGKSLIKAVDSVAQPCVLSASVFDLRSANRSMSIYYAYRCPRTGKDFNSVVATLKDSLTQILKYFLPFAGRVVPNQVSHEPEMHCNNAGMELMEALADIPLESFDFYNLDKSLKRATADPSDMSEVALRLQVTGYVCGGFSLAWTFNHLIADAAGFVKFLTLWAELARSKHISTIPNNDRTIFGRWAPREPTGQLERIYKEYTMGEIPATPHCSNSVKRLYYVDGSSLERLRTAASQGGKTRTRTEAFSAHLWKIFAGTADGETSCKMAWPVDGRPMIKELGLEVMSSYVGNLCALAIGEASTAELKEGSLEKVAGIVSNIFRPVASEDYFAEFVRWFEERRSSGKLVRVKYGSNGPAIMVSSCHNMPAMATDFGLGAPMLGTFYSTDEIYRIGYVNLFPSGKGDGSWFVFAFVLSKLAAAMESDPDRLFEPVTMSHLEI